MKRLPIMLISPNAILPNRSTDGSVGFDLSACIETSITIQPGETCKIGSGVCIALKHGFAAFIYARSGLGVNNGIVPANCVGVIDSDYRGEIIIGLKNTSCKPYIINAGDKIAQMVITKCEMPRLIVCEKLDSTSRGAHGFGSTDCPE